MIKATKLVYDVEQEWARFNTDHSKNLRYVDILRVINKAQNIYVDHACENIEVNSKYRTILKPLEKKEISLDIEEKEDNYIVASFPKNSLKLLRQRAVCKSGEQIKEIPITLVQSDDLDRSLNSPYWQPDFAWEQVIGDEGDKGLWVWHKGKFAIEKVYVDYIRRPQEIHAPTLVEGKGSYKDWNGEVRTEDQDCELDERYSAVTLVNLAVLILDSTVNDAQDYQLKAKEILEASRLASV